MKSRNFRIVRLSNYPYRKALDAAKYGPNLSYAEKLNWLLNSGSIYGKGFSVAMNQLGNDAHEIVADAEDVQKTWARENNFYFTDENWSEQIVLAQLAQLRPDIVYFQDGYSLTREVRESLKSKFPFIKKTVMFKGFPAHLNEIADIDIHFMGIPSIVRKCQELGFKAHLLYHSFDASILDRLKNHESTAPRSRFTFVGSSGYGYQEHWSRYWLLHDLLQKTDLCAWLNEDHTVPTRWSQKLQLTVGAWVNRYVSSQSLKPLSERIESKHNRLAKMLRSPLTHAFHHNRIRPPVFGLDMYDVIRSSAVLLNKHTDAALGECGNMRMFEATGVGSCMLTENASNLSDLFIQDSEVVTYSSIDECIEKANYLLAHPDYSQQIAAAGQRRALRDHTAFNRCEKIHEVISASLD